LRDWKATVLVGAALAAGLLVALWGGANNQMIAVPSVVAILIATNWLSLRGVAAVTGLAVAGFLCVALLNHASLLSILTGSLGLVIAGLLGGQVARQRDRLTAANQRLGQRESEFRLRDEQLRIALADSPIFVFNQDRDLRFTWLYNAPFEGDAAGLIGKVDAAIYPEEVAAALTTLKRAVLEAGVGLRQDLSLVADGQAHDLDVKIEPLYDETGEIVGITGAAIDVAERNELLRRQRRVQEALRSSMTITAEQLRGPLAVLKAILDHLPHRPGSRLTQADLDLLAAADSARGALERLAIVLRDGAAIDAGELSVRREVTDLAAVARQVVSAQQAAAGGHLLILQAPDEVRGCWDSTLLEQAVSNLVSNAVRYSAEGSAVRVRVEQSGGLAQLTVTDQGAGIAPEELERLFDPFHRAVRPGSPSGMGLGLYIARGIVEAQGGSVDVDSRPGAGSTFRIELPMEQRPCEPEPRIAADHAADEDEALAMNGRMPTPDLEPPPASQEPAA
jgi:signal transduction histidine kinase